ncbi:GNAT family N-acetyltransferase [Actinocrinis sp.]|uniref:GNAT family N-acetyltransferase n=1 Tax=Actinocrinis sp. TaxID=1920516 RepID=UPI0032C21225
MDDVDVLGGRSERGPGREDVLDNPVWHALAGDHADVAERVGRAARYRPDVSVFAGLDDLDDERAWADAARLAGPGGSIVTAGVSAPPAGWQTRFSLPGVQMVATALESGPDPEAVRLGPADVPEMLDLVARTDPGPFRERTIELGTYLGIRRDGALVAMAGERLSLPGWTEVSAVCTDPAHRGRGLAARLVRAVAAGIEARGRTPILHAAAANANAIRLYEKLGFTLRRPIVFAAFELSS